MQLHVQNIQEKFVYHSHWLNVKLTATKTCLSIVFTVLTSACLDLKTSF